MWTSVSPCPLALRAMRARWANGQNHAVKKCRGVSSGDAGDTSAMLLARPLIHSLGNWYFVDVDWNQVRAWGSAELGPCAGLSCLGRAQWRFGAAGTRGRWSRGVLAGDERAEGAPCAWRSSFDRLR